MLSLKRQKTSELLASSSGFYVPAIDEFGGYSSRLRIPETTAANASASTEASEKCSIVDKKPSKKASTTLSELRYEEEDGQKKWMDKDANLSLHHLLGIDVEKIALEIVMQDLQKSKGA